MGAEAGSASGHGLDTLAMTTSSVEGPEEAHEIDPEHWVDRHGDALYRYARLRLKDRDLAAELVQETFLQGLRGREAYAGGAPERTWLVGILRHKILDHYRRTIRERGQSTGTGDDGPDWEERLFDRRGHWIKGPARWLDEPGADLERAEFWERLGSCLGGLPTKLSEAFLLSALDGLDGEEVCDLLGITPANLWTRLHRARMLLRGCLERHWFGGSVRNAGGQR